MEKSGNAAALEIVKCGMDMAGESSVATCITVVDAVEWVKVDISVTMVFRQYTAGDFCCGSDVLLVHFAECFCIFRQGCLADGRMFFVHIATTGLVDPGDITIAFVLVVENFMETHQPGGFTAGNQRQLELPVADLPFLYIRLRHIFRFGQVVEGTDYPRFPGIVAIFDALGQGHALQDHTQVSDVPEFLRGHFSHSKTALTPHLDETVGAQSIQGFPQWGGPHLVGALEEFDAEFCAGLEFAVDDIFPEAFVRLVCQCWCIHVVRVVRPLL